MQRKRRTEIRKYAAENTSKRNAQAIAFEAEMDRRIIDESALIRAEWDDDTRHKRLGGKSPDVSVTKATIGRSRRNGVDC